MDRRRALKLLALAAASPAAAGPISVHPSEPDSRFRHGVASGDPGRDSVVLWTRATPTARPDSPMRVRWEMARDRRFRRIAAHGWAEAGPERDFTVKVLADGLEPGADYWYRFSVGEDLSPVGRTRTLATGPLARAVLAFVCCQHYECGLFNAHRAIAGLKRLDAVVHLGDYIYEDAPLDSAFVRHIAEPLGRAVVPGHETVSLADYRARHARYRTDPDLQAAHARAPWICVWDDHEVADDCWKDGSRKHRADRDGGWSAREAAALRAYYEWMPIREPAAGRTELAINRAFDFGDLLTLAMLETRLMARAHQVTYDDLPMTAGPDGPRPDIEALKARIADPARQLLGARQEAWLAGTLQRSVAEGKAWQVIGSQVVMGRVAAPDFKALLGPELTGLLVEALPQDKRREAETRIQLLGHGLPYNTDAWDGYPAARERLYAAFRGAGARPVVVSGDSHAFWVNELTDAADRRVGVELGCGSVTSPGAGDALPMVDFNAMFREANRDVRFCDHRAKGFVRLTLTRDAMQGELIAVSTVRAKPFVTRVLKKARVRRRPGGGLGGTELV